MSRVPLIGFLLPLLEHLSHSQVLSKKSFEVDLEKFEPFTTTELEYFDPGTLRITRKGRNNFCISGDYTFMKNMGDETFMTWEIKMKSITGTFEPLMQGGDIFCQYLNNDKKYWPKIRANSNMPNPAPCPFPKGTYTIKDFHIEEDFLPSIIPAGEYICVVSFKINDVVAFGYNVYSTVKISP